MIIDRDLPEEHIGDEPYFELGSKRAERGFDARLLAEPLSILPKRRPLVFSGEHTVSEAMSAMQQQGRGAVLITDDGTQASRITGIFTDRDVLLRVVGHGRNPALLPIAEVMTPDPEHLPSEATIAWVLNRMGLSGFRHVPVVDEGGRPMFIISVRDVVQFLAEFFPREVLNLPPEFGGGCVRAREGA